MKSLCICLILIFLSACAQKQVVLRTAELTPLKNLEDRISFTQTRGLFRILPFQDLRKDPNKVGVANTGFFNADTPVHLDIATSAYVQKRIQAGLAKRGIDVTGAAPYSLRGSIRRLWVWEHVTGYSPEYANCEVELDFVILDSKTKQLRYKGVVSSNASGTESIFESTDSVGPILETCMEFIAEKLVQDSQIRQFIASDIPKP